MEQNKDIEEVENLLQKLMENYQNVLLKLPEFKEETELHKVKKTAKEMAENLLKIQSFMHKIIDGFVSTEEPELVDQSIFPEYCKELPEIKKELYANYSEKINKCMAAYKSNPFLK